MRKRERESESERERERECTGRLKVSSLYQALSYRRCIIAAELSSIKNREINLVKATFF
jgi:hypothetical protein